MGTGNGRKRCQASGLGKGTQLVSDALVQARHFPEQAKKKFDVVRCAK
jgi:hypothetical protein